MAADGMMTLDVENISKVENGLEKFSEMFGVPIRYLAMDQLRLAVQDLVKFTPPKNEKEGKNRIGKELWAVFMEVDSPDILAEWEAVANGQSFPARVFKLKTGAVFAVESTLIEHSGAGMHDHHQQYRSKASGRTTSAGTRTRDIGRWRFVNKMAVTRSAMGAYRKRVQSRVGFLKAGWLPAVRALESATGQGITVPGFVKKVWQQRGRVSLDSMTTRGDGFVSATNAVEWGGPMITRFAVKTMRKRAHDINRGIFRDGRARQIVERYNAGRIG